MSLVDYASSDEEDEAVGREEGRHNDNLVISHTKPSHHPPNQKATRLPVQQSDNSINHSESSTFRLPDASLLLDSPSLPSSMIGSYDHTSRVAAAMAQNESRKRDSKESTASYPRGKIPRGNLPHSKHVPETAFGLLRPPQLSGRSNVVTEDITKLFTRRNGSEPSSSSSRSTSG
ncbi:uncharacterized protein LOC112519433 [Cynara cardunculus var. scolymus]|uniref:Uncharacterized protein n=1 Tax=Cynara cardunculus var. scolymus TaxID=59895 RepID=A0A103Y1G3_CYNCS|nr:uncharacterized protein LOC112519433 [Cynara cardunculus var. scolymus]KVI00784.1 hypothetical protein Ccrd_020960 [Cynara cardunculus var. scolymus]